MGAGVSVVTAGARMRIGTTAGMAGAIAILAGSVAAAIAYTGKAGEAYSPLHHFVSELGEPGVSALGPEFNVGLIVGGIGFAVFMAMLASSTTGAPRVAYGVVGVIAGIAGFFVGVFPMNFTAQHGLAAMTFFNLGWIAVALASIDFVRRRDPRFPRRLAVVGGLTVLAFIAFLVSIRVDPIIAESSLGTPVERPTVWIVPALEWAVIAGILLWTFLVAWTWRRAG